MITFANIPETEKKRVVIIGAGFGGLALARKLDRKIFQVVLIDKNNYHQFQPLFYQVATAGLEPSAISFPLRKIFQKKTDFHIRVCDVKEINAQQNYLLTDIGRINFNYLIIATGADTNFYGNQEIMNNAMPMKSVSEALYIRNQVLSNFEFALVSKDEALKNSLLNIVVVGGGPTGVEICGTLADMKKTVLPKDYPELDFNLMTITLIESSERLLKSMSETSSHHAKKFLEKRGVKVMLNTRVTGFNGDVISLQNNQNIVSKTLIWAAGIKPNTIPGLSEESIHGTGRIKVNAFNQVEGYQHIFALGDVCISFSDPKFPTGHPQIAQPAIQQGELLVKNLKSLERKTPMKPFTYKDLGSMATVGRNFAVVELPFFKFQGLRAWLFWMLVHLMAILGVKNRLMIFINWVWNYISYDQSLRLIIKPRRKSNEP